MGGSSEVGITATFRIKMPGDTPPAISTGLPFGKSDYFIPRDRASAQNIIIANTCSFHKLKSQVEGVKPHMCKRRSGRLRSYGGTRSMGPRVLMPMGYPAGMQSTRMAPLPRTYGTSSGILPWGTAFITKARALNARPSRLRPLFAVHDCCSTGGGADGVMYLFMASSARTRAGLIGCCRQAAVGAKSTGAQRCGSSRFIRRGQPWTS